MAKQPHSQDNHGFSFYNNYFCSSGLAELQQPRIPQYHAQQSQYQQQLPQNQQLWQGHVVPIIDPHVYDSNIFNFPTLVALFEKQWQETNQFINIQNEQMKFILQHQRELQVAAFRNMEICLHRIIKRKDEEIAIAIKKKQEMEKLLRRQEAEKKELKRIAEKRGVMVIALHTKLKEEKKRARMLLENDVESCCDKNEEARAEKRIRRENDMMFCQKCKENSPSVLFLPCRHICSCQPCEALLEDCPICGIKKKGVIEIPNFILE